MMRYKRLLVLEPDPEALRQEYWQGETTYADSSPCSKSNMPGAWANRAGSDKSLNTERYADPIFDAYPNARMIHMIATARAATPL